MNLLKKLKQRFAGQSRPVHLQRGILGEQAAKKYLQHAGLKFLTANFRSNRGEMDLIFRDNDCLLFVSFDRNILTVNLGISNETKAGNQLCAV